MIMAEEPPCPAAALASLVQFLYEFHPAQASFVGLCEIDSVA
jgi:hypothetical protein